MARSRSRDLLRRGACGDPRDGLLLSWPRHEGRRPAAPSRMRAALARAVARLFLHDRIDPAGRQLRDRLLPAEDPSTIHDRGDRAVARFPTGTFLAAASELARDTLAARQPMVRKGGAARAARPRS